MLAKGFLSVCETENWVPSKDSALAFVEIQIRSRNTVPTLKVPDKITDYTEAQLHPEGRSMIDCEQD